jgi:hypothetical protein
MPQVHCMYAAVYKKGANLELIVLPVLQALTETDYKNKITSGHIQSYNSDYFAIPR